MSPHTVIAEAEDVARRAWERPPPALWALLALGALLLAAAYAWTFWVIWRVL